MKKPSRRELENAEYYLFKVQPTCEHWIDRGDHKSVFNDFEVFFRELISGHYRFR
jgi:hypothetical protein